MIVPAIIRATATYWAANSSSERRYKISTVVGIRTTLATKKFAATAADSWYFANHLPMRVPPSAEHIGTGPA
jgi:hypothetical protein